jgi:peptidoglycan/LPS O-acetylase OafA/YrhL
VSVIAFHVGTPGISGGFVGVDVFFVISGFLITGLLLADAERHGRIQIIDFYARRVRRILPALTLVVFATLVLGSAVLLPTGEQQELGQSALSIAAFASNVYFWRTHLGYFATDTQPLLHTWTLAVEEQFYFAWPAVLILGLGLARHFRFNAKGVIAAVLLLGILLSAVLCSYYTFYQPVPAFYLTPFRAWEFGLGALLAVVVNPKPWNRIGAWLTGSGLALIGASVLVIDRKTEFPGVAAWLPCIGASAVILGGSISPGSWPSWCLSVRPLVRIGKLSYSWYLWHWPLLAIARSATLGEASFIRDAMIALIALGLAEITYRFVENPIRRGKPWPFNKSGSAVAGGAVLMLLTAFTASALLIHANKVEQGDSLLVALAEAETQRPALPQKECDNFERPFRALAPADNCLLGKRNGPITVVWGDSHAHHLIPMLAAAAKKRGEGLLPRTMGGCAPLLPSAEQVINDRYDIDCSRFISAVLRSLENMTPPPAGSKVVMAARWNNSDPAKWEDALQRTAQTIRTLGFQVILVADVPSYPWNVPKCVGRLGEPACRITRESVDAGRAATLEVLKRVARNVTGVSLWDPIDALCDKTRCSPIRNGIVVYADGDHLSVAGSLSLVNDAP